MQKECIKTQKERHTEVPEVFASAFLLYVALFTFMRSSTRHKMRQKDGVYTRTRRSRPQRSAVYCGVLPQKAQPLCLMPFGRCPKRFQTLLTHPHYARASVSTSKCSLCMLTSPAAGYAFSHRICRTRPVPQLAWRGRTFFERMEKTVK